MARYYQSTPQNFTSQFVPENLELQQGYFDNMQAKQDAYKLNIEGLNKQTNALVNDIPGAVEAKKRIEGRLGELRNLNYNDPTDRDKAMKGTMELRSAFDTFGELGARDDKKKRYDLAQQEIEKDKNDFKKAYRLQELKQANLSSDRAIKFDDYGKPLNTEIITPDDWEYKDKTKWMSDALKDVFSDTSSVNSGLSNEQAQRALLSYMSGNVEERTGEKIYNSVKQRALADPNLMKSIKAEGLVYGQDPNAIFETALSGLVGGGKYKNVDVERKYRDDELAQYAAKKAIDAKDEELTAPVNIGATNVMYDPNMRADAPSKAGEFFKNFSLTKEIYFNLYPNETAGTPAMDLTKPFSADQKTILDKAEKFYGHTSTDKKTQAELINKYLEDWGKNQLNIGIDQYTNAKKVENENQIYFGGVTKGAKAATTRKFTTITGDNAGAEETGSDFLEKYGDPDKYIINTTGKLNSDNPYYSAGRVITVSDKAGKVVGQYAMSGDNREMSGGNNLKHSLYRNLKYNPKGEYEVDLPTSNGKQKFKFEYEPITTNTLDANGRPTKPVDGAKERLVVKDSKGKVVYTGESDVDVIDTFYKQFEEQ